MYRARAALALFAALSLSAAALASAEPIPASAGTLDVTVTDVTNAAAPSLVATASLPIQAGPGPAVDASLEGIDRSRNALQASLPQTQDYRSSCTLDQGGKPTYGPVSQTHYGLGGEVFAYDSVYRVNLVHADLVSQNTFEKDGCELDLPTVDVAYFSMSIKLTVGEALVQSRVSGEKTYEYRYQIRPVTSL